jgi:isocitrate lyase
MEIELRMQGMKCSHSQGKVLVPVPNFRTIILIKAC